MAVYSEENTALRAITKSSVASGTYGFTQSGSQREGQAVAVEMHIAVRISFCYADFSLHIHTNLIQRLKTRSCRDAQWQY